MERLFDLLLLKCRLIIQCRPLHFWQLPFRIRSFLLLIHLEVADCLLITGNKEHNENIYFVRQPLEVEKRGTTSDIRPFERISPDSASLAKQPRLDVDQAPPNSACTDPAHSTAFTVFTGRHSDSWVINMIFSIVLPSTRIELMFYDFK